MKKIALLALLFASAQAMDRDNTSFPRRMVPSQEASLQINTFSGMPRQEEEIKGSAIAGSSSAFQEEEKGSAIAQPLQKGLDASISAPKLIEYLKNWGLSPLRDSVIDLANPNISKEQAIQAIINLEYPKNTREEYDTIKNLTKLDNDIKPLFSAISGLLYKVQSTKKNYIGKIGFMRMIFPILTDIVDPDIMLADSMEKELSDLKSRLGWDDFITSFEEKLDQYLSVKKSLDAHPQALPEELSKKEKQIYDQLVNMVEKFPVLEADETLFIGHALCASRSALRDSKFSNLSQLNEKLQNIAQNFATTQGVSLPDGKNGSYLENQLDFIRSIQIKKPTFIKDLAYKIQFDITINQ
jgi:hypothetical protein